MTALARIRVHYLTLKIRALCWVLRIGSAMYQRLFPEKPFRKSGLPDHGLKSGRWDVLTVRMAGDSNKINLPVTFASPALMACSVMSQKREPVGFDNFDKLAKRTL